MEGASVQYALIFNDNLSFLAGPVLLAKEETTLKTAKVEMKVQGTIFKPRV